jgi:hypothetical protein
MHNLALVQIGPKNNLQCMYQWGCDALESRLVRDVRYVVGLLHAFIEGKN